MPASKYPVVIMLLLDSHHMSSKSGPRNQQVATYLSYVYQPLHLTISQQIQCGNKEEVSIFHKLCFWLTDNQITKILSIEEMINLNE